MIIIINYIKISISYGNLVFKLLVVSKSKKRVLIMHTIYL